jgi:hypothetical protein
MSEAAGTTPSRRRWLNVVLTVSLAVNLFLIGGIAGTMTLMRAEMAPGRPLERAAVPMKLDAAQDAAFRNLQTVMRQRGRAMRQANQTLWTALADPSTGNDKIAGLLDEGVRNKTGFENDTATAFGQFLTSLTPTQRTEFIGRLRALHRSHGPLHLFRRLFR